MGEWDAPHLDNKDHLIMPYIDLCNVACGGHAGSESIMEDTIALAGKFNVKVGAHPGYMDKKNFGREYIEMESQELGDLFRSQIDHFLNIAEKLGIAPYHIKPHGALYHACNHRELEMNILIDIIKSDYSNLTLIVYPNSILCNRATVEGLSILSESFIDRTYTECLKLSSRKEEGAVITSEKQAVKQFEILSEGKIITKNGIVMEMVTQTACIHGDNPSVFEILKSIRQ